MTPVMPCLAFLTVNAEAIAALLPRHGGLGEPGHQGISGFGPKPASHGFAVGTPKGSDFGSGKVGVN